MLLECIRNTRYNHIVLLLLLLLLPPPSTSRSLSETGVFVAHGAQPLAELSPVRRAKRGPPPPKAAAPAEGGTAEGGRALRATSKRKLEATKLESNKHGAYKQPWSAGKRALHERDSFDEL